MPNIAELFYPESDLIAYRLDELDCFGITIKKKFSEIKNAENLKIRNVTQIMNAGGWAIAGRFGYIDISEPGLYRVYNQKDLTGLQWIVYDKNINKFASSVSSIFYHHADEPPLNYHNNLEGVLGLFNYVMENFTKGQIGCTCLSASIAFSMFSRTLKLKSVTWEFLEIKENQFRPSKSHAMTEIIDPISGKKCLFDVDKKYTFLNESNENISLNEFLELTNSNIPIKLKKLSNTRFAGYGPSLRMPSKVDFINDLTECAGENYLQEVFKAIGQATVIWGLQYQGDAQRILHPVSYERLKTLKTTSTWDAIEPTNKDLVEKFLKLNVAEF
jgi:hypothetical protein